jgi:hypothetical protein
MKDKIEQALQALMDLPLCSAGRAATLFWFHFGSQREVVDRDGETKLVGEYALHVECTWRITGLGGIAVGSGDLYYPAGVPVSRNSKDFDWRKQGANRADERLSTLLHQLAQAPLVVEGVWADATGSIRLTLSHGYALEVFPSDSLQGEYSEHWRLFQPSLNQPHYVLTGAGHEVH